MLSLSVTPALLISFDEYYEILLLVYKQCSLIVIVNFLNILRNEPYFTGGLYSFFYVVLPALRCFKC